MIDNELLLFIEPSQEPSEEPLIDELTRKVAASFRKARKGFMGRQGWDEGICTRGFHLCSCGAMSSNVNYLLPNGEETNSLCIHYMAMHRAEVPEEQLERVRLLEDGEEEPSEREVTGKRFKKGLGGMVRNP